MTLKNVSEHCLPPACSINADGLPKSGFEIDENKFQLEASVTLKNVSEHRRACMQHNRKNLVEMDTV